MADSSSSVASSCWPPSLFAARSASWGGVDAGRIKAPDAERPVVFYGRRGRPANRPRCIPAQLVHQLARKLQAKRLGTVAVL